MRDGDEEAFFGKKVLMVGEFRAEADIDVFFGDFGEEVFGDHGDFAGGAAADEVSSEGLFDGGGQFVDFFGVLVDGASEGVFLLHDFFDHEVGKVAFFGGLGFPVDFDDAFFNNLFGLVVVEFDFGLAVFGFDDGHLIVVEIDDAIGVFEEGGNVRGDEVFFCFGVDADYDGRSAAGSDNFVFAFFEDDNGEAAVDFFTGEFNGCFEVVGFVDFGDEVGNDFSVAVGFECEAFLFEDFFVFEVVFENAVVDEDDFAVFAGVRMGVFEFRFSVGRPAGVAECERGFREGVFAQGVADFADFFMDFDFVVGFVGDAPRVVAAIFE